MPKKASDLQISDKLKVLLYGEFASGKTTMATTFPKPIMVFDTDSGQQTYAGIEGIEYEIYKDDPTKKRPDGYQRFRRDLDLANTWDYKTFLLDSTTSLLDIIISDIIGSQGGKNVNEGLSLQQWGIVTNRFEEVFRKINALNAHVIVTGHTQMFQDDLSGEIRYVTMMVGRKFPQKAPLFFDEVYRCFTEQDRKTKEITYQVQTRSDRKYPARSRFNLQNNGKTTPILDMYEPSNFEAIYEKVKKARGME